MKAIANRHGHWGEFIACMFLRIKGYRILAQRFKTPVGEIDIVAKRGQFIVAVEVKYRQKIEDAAYAIVPHQQRRISRALEWFISTQQHRWQHLRFDVMLCSRFKIKHIQNAW